MSYTQVPYALNEDGETIYRGGDCVATVNPLQPYRQALAVLGETTRKENAAFIVKACNNHEALVTDLSAITLALIAQLAVPGSPLYGDVGTRNFVTRARATLAQVQS